MANYILAIDAGTTSNRAVIFDRSGRIVSAAQKEIKQSFPQPGWVEQDANELWSTQLGVVVEALNRHNLEGSDLAAIGITNQRETTILWSKETGEPVYPAIVWQCRRTAEACQELHDRGYAELIQAKTGLLPDAYFSASKIKWLLEQVEGLRARAEAGEILFGTVDSWLIWKLTKGRVHVTDYSNAARTMLFNIHDLSWDQDLLDLFEIPAAILPEVKASSCIYGYTDPAFLAAEVPIAGAAGDQQAALFGQQCWAAGEVKNTYGTGSFLLMNTGEKAINSKHGLVSTIAWGLNDQIDYALEGSIFVSGGVVQWLRDELRLIDFAHEVEALAAEVPDSNGCYFVPAFTGLGAPYWDPYARGAIVGLSRGVRREHIVRAALESMAFQTEAVLSLMQEEAGVKLKSLRVDGGAAQNNLLLQFQADLSNLPVERPECIESTALGAAFLAGLAVAFWASRAELKSLVHQTEVFQPNLAEATREKILADWAEAVKRSLNWAQE
ncbi:MAG: glycerol kinase GlpK [Eubacteriales bacterium]|nr:glycerol kinase GlpK [Eubacteriales bacterium]